MTREQMITYYKEQIKRCDVILENCHALNRRRDKVYIHYFTKLRLRYVKKMCKLGNEYARTMSN